MAMGKVLKTMSIHPQSFTISKQEFFDQPFTQLKSAGVKYTRAPLAARGSTTCSMVQTCQVNWAIKIPKNTLAIQLNKVPATVVNSDAAANAAVNFNGKASITTEQTDDMTQGAQRYALIERFTTRSIIAGKRHCGLWMQDFLQDLKVVWLNKTDTVANSHLAYQMIPPEKLDIIYLQNDIAHVVVTTGTQSDTYVYNYGKFSARIVNMQGVAVDGKAPQNTISQIKDAAMFMTFAMPKYPTWFFTVLFHTFDLVIDQRHVIPQPYEALTQADNGQIGTRAYPDPVQVGLTPITHYLCDAIVRIMFDDNPDTQVLIMEVIGEMGGSMIRNG
ncbi:MAG: hypothetical protein EZS28_000726 [Streblomastix strix]|uniref:Capsid protein n=1 Tax=Streblomastix strix TaxID=222440 RepID=A0A5J4XAC0_9EUKA|nr:MAG: hypothetical protein EZS28_000726 [Streblomastix strix]